VLEIVYEEIKKDYLPIKKGFKLDGIKKMNIIIGKNSTGKTRFFQAIKRDYEQDIDIIFIRANDVNPSKDQYKTTASSSELISNVSKLFNNLNIKPKLNIKDIKPKLEDLINKTNKNFKEFTSNSDISISNSINENLKIETVIQALLDKFVVSEIGVEKELSLDDIGQGYQRMLVASILKSYIDMLKEVGIKEKGSSDKDVVLLFEEPELFLHPELKRILNRVLRDISEYYTVIISTHDPYFLWSNKNDDDIATFCFEKDKKNGLTKEPIEGEVSYEGIEDEILHINLFNKLILKLGQKENKKLSLASRQMEDTSEIMVKYLNDKELEDIREYEFKGNNNILLPIYIRNILHHDDITKIKEGEIEKSIKIMSKILDNI